MKSILLSIILIFIISLITIFSGCGDSPNEEILSPLDKWEETEKWNTYQKLKKEYLAGNYNYLIQYGPAFINKYGVSYDQEIGEIYYLIGESYYKQGKYSEAISEFKKLKQNLPFSEYTPWAYLGIANCYREDKTYSFESAIQEYELSIQKYPEHPIAKEAQFYIGDCYYRLASSETEFLTAINELKKTLQKYSLKLNDPIRRKTNYLLGKCYEEKPNPDYELAIQYYLNAAENGNSFEAGDIYYHIGWLYETLGNTNKAKEYYLTVIEHYEYSTYYNEALNRYNNL